MVQRKLFNTTDAVAEVFAHYQTYHPQWKARPSTSTEAKRVRDRIKDGYTVDELKAAIDGNHKCPWHSGLTHPEGKKFHDLLLIMRDATHVARFIEKAAEAEHASNGKAKQEASRRVVRETVERHDTREEKARERLHGPEYDTLPEAEQIALAVSEGMAPLAARRAPGLRRLMALAALEKRANV